MGKLVNLRKVEHFYEKKNVSMNSLEEKGKNWFSKWELMWTWENVEHIGKIMIWDNAGKNN